MFGLLILGAAGLGAGTPAPAFAGINLGSVNAAPAPTAVGPPVIGDNGGYANQIQTSVYNPAAASASASAAVSGVATATGSTPDQQKRGLDERSFCFAGYCIGGTPSKTTVTPTPTPYVATTAKTSPVTTAAPTTTSSYFPYYQDVPSTCQPDATWTNTFAFTTSTSCPQPYEVGTYCGFRNPEDPCAPQPDGYAPKTTPDTDTAFLANDVYHKMARNAVTPSGYNRTFVDLNAAVNANSYMGVYTMQSYDVQACAAKCDSTNLCTAFNFYIERDPLWNPAGCNCTGTNTASMASYKCTLWGSGVEPSAATNDGQWASGFHVVNTASNGYEKTNVTTPVTPPGWTNPQKCSGAHDHPRTCIGEKLFKGVFDVSICATYANQQNAVNNRSGLFSLILSLFGISYNPGKCNFFNAFMLKQDGTAQGTYCKLYAQQYAPSVGNIIPGWNSGHFYGVESSWSFCSS